MDLCLDANTTRKHFVNLDINYAHVCVFVCVILCICMYVSMYVYMYVCEHVYVYKCSCVCITRFALKVR